MYFGRQVAVSNRRVLLDYALDKVARPNVLVFYFIAMSTRPCLHTSL